MMSKKITVNGVSKTVEEIFNFPCDYSFKIFGKKCDELQDEVCAVVQKDSDEIHPKNIIVKESSKGGYISITVKIIATSKEQIDKINAKLHNHSLIAYVL